PCPWSPSWRRTASPPSCRFAAPSVLISWRAVEVRTPRVAMPQRWDFVGWFYNRDGQRVGPLTTAEVVRLLTSGELAPTDMLTKAFHDGRRTHFYLGRASAALALADGASEKGKGPRPG